MSLDVKCIRLSLALLHNHQAGWLLGVRQWLQDLRVDEAVVIYFDGDPVDHTSDDLGSEVVHSEDIVSLASLLLNERLA